MKDRDRQELAERIEENTRYGVRYACIAYGVDEDTADKAGQIAGRAAARALKGRRA